MTADKRSVHTDALQTLGTIITAAEKRDAIHLAVEPCVAGIRLYAGQHVGIRDGKAYTDAVPQLGIVDPFLTTAVQEGQMFWLVVYPRQITSLRHVWEHPAFPDSQAVPGGGVAKIFSESRARSERWLRNFCETNDTPTYEDVMAAIEGTFKNDEEGYVYARYDSDSLHFGGSDAHASIPDEFWDHVETVLGRKVPYRPEYFSCSC